MKTAISIPDPVFDAAEELAQRLDISRRQGITEALDRVYGEESSELDPVWATLQAASLPADEW